jgi:polysaccharide export outer membrane protein
MRFGITFINAAFLLLLAVLLQGCSGGSNAFGDSSTKNMAPGQFSQVAQAGQTNDIAGSKAARVDKIFAKGAAAPDNPQDYRIGALDVLDIAVLGVADLNKSVQVNSGGTITLPLIRQVRAAGRTQAELERDIASRLSQTYLQNPQVTVGIKEYNSQRITVDGAVQKPGIFPKQGDMSLLQAIAQAQGLTNFADPTGVLVFRTIDHKRMAARYDIRKVRSGKLPDPLLLAGDVVMVDENSAKTTLRDISSAMPLTGLFSVIPLL